MSRQRPAEALLDLLWNIREYLPEIVIIGGWVPYLYQQYGGFATWGAALSFTYEMDLLVDRSVPRSGRAPFADLLESAGLQPVDSGARGAIWEGKSAAMGKVELFVAHTGTARRQAQVTSIEQQPRLSGIALTDTELLRDHTTQLAIPVRSQRGTIGRLHVTVPSLGAFVTTKAATFFKRPRMRTMRARTRRVPKIYCTSAISLRPGRRS